MERQERPKKEKKQKKSSGGPQEMSTSQCGGAYSFLTRMSTGPKLGDPRFREECGDVDHIGIVKNYSFLQKNREMEIAQINKTLADSNAQVDREALKRKKQSLQDQYKTNDGKLKDIEERINWHREERQRILEGKKPFWLDKKAMREKKHAQKMKELEESGRMNKYLIKKGKKQAARDKKRGIIAGMM